MVRIGPYVLFEKAKPQPQKTEEQFKGQVGVGYGGKPARKVFHLGEHTWLNRCKHFETLAQDYPLFNQSCLALAGLVMSQGVFTKPAVNKQDETYALAEEADWRIKKLHKDIRVNSKFYETVLRMAKFGSAFWEVTYQPRFDFRLAPYQECIEPWKTDDIGNVTYWRQVINGTPTATWPAEPTNDECYLVHVGWNVTSASWPYGTSLGTGSETELEALLDMETNAKDYMEKQAWPYEVLSLGKEGGTVLESEYSSAKTEWRNRKPGEGIVTRNMSTDIIPGGTGSSPIRELAVLCELMKDNAHDGLMVAPLSKLYNSTEASAKVLTQHIMTTLGQPIQWILKEEHEERVLKPYLAQNAFSVKSCPEVLFESPDVHKKEEGEYWKLMVDSKIQSPKQACDHLGLEYDEDYWTAEEKRQQEQFEQKQQQGFQQEQKSEEVWEVRRKGVTK